VVRKFLLGERKPLIDVLLAVIISVAVMAGFGVWYTHRAISNMERKFCTLVVLSDDAYKQPLPPGIPNSPTRQKLAAANHKLRIDLNCDDGKH
jgi:hypothetical protein